MIFKGFFRAANVFHYILIKISLITLKIPPSMYYHTSKFLYQVHCKSVLIVSRKQANIWLDSGRNKNNLSQDSVIRNCWNTKKLFFRVKLHFIEFISENCWHELQYFNSWQPTFADFYVHEGRCKDEIWKMNTWGWYLLSLDLGGRRRSYFVTNFWGIFFLDNLDHIMPNWDQNWLFYSRNFNNVGTHI